MQSDQDYSDEEDSMVSSGVFVSNNNSVVNSVNLETQKFDDFNSDDSDDSDEDETYDQRIEADPSPSSDLLQQNLSQIVDPYPNNNPYSNDNLYDPQNYEYDYKSQASESLSEEYQATSELVNPTPISYGELLNEDLPNGSEKNDQNLINNSSKIRARKDNKSTEPKNYFREAIRSHKNNSIDSNEFGKDLAECIPGLYRLLDLSKVDDSSSSVDKVTISKDSLKKLCNNIIPSSFKSISEIDYKTLNSISFRLIGCYGNHFLIAKFLLNKKIIDQKIYDLLITSDNKNKSSLRPGIYLLVVDQSFDLGLVIQWSEPGCYEENASLQHKNNMIYLHRCLTKLTDCQLCFMSDKDLDSFDWNLNSLDLDSGHENGSCYEFEVETSEEEKDNFKLNPGFKVNLPNEIKTEIKNNIQYDVPLYPIVVESATNISFITRKMAISSDIESLTCSASTFSTELRNRLQGRSLSINRESMTMKQLEILINNGFEAEKELLNPFHDALNALKSRRGKEFDQLKHTMKEDEEIITRMGWKKSYSIFGSYVDNDNAANNNISEEEINRIQSKYPEVKDMIKEKEIKIDSSAWIKLKQRYALSYIVVRNVYKLLDKPGKIPDETIDKALQELYFMFVDKETDTHKLVEKYVKRSLTGANPTFNRIEQQAKIFTQNKNDSDFVQEYLTKPFFGKKNNMNQKVLEVFLNEYQNWKKENFPNTVKEMVPEFSFNKEEMEKIREKFSQEKKDIENREFEKIRSKLEKNYNNGPLRVNILTIADEDNIRLTYKLETNQLQITIYETLLKESDILKIQDDEFYISNPILTSDSSGQHGVDFLINPIVYDFRKISQIDICKFLLVLFNKKSQQIEIYFDTAQKLAQGFKESSIKPFKVWKSDKNFLIAINEPKELIAIFDTRNVMLSVFAFSDDKTNLYARNPEIQLLQCYSGTTPNIQHFLFIKDTEEICFVEKGGQARIFNLINKKFRPTICDLPPNTSNVLSSPDGSCIVAFAKETTIDDEQEICRAVVYFCRGSFNKVELELPPTIQSLEFLQFTCVNKLQTHLMSFNLKNGCLVSAIVKITLEKTQYRFQERTQRPLVRVNLANSFCNYTSIEGKYTQFEKYIQNGQKIMIMGEEFNIIKVVSDTELRVAGNFKSTSRFDKWMEFQIEPIEPKTKLNDLIDVYKLMFEKYPIENWIDSEQNNPLNLKIVLDIDNDDIEEYGEKFEYYIYENLRYSTKKLATILKKFSVSFTKFQELVENVKFLKKCSSDHSPEYKLGEWMIKLCCLIPIKIAVARNNLFQPLNDEMNEVDWVESGKSDNGYGHYVDSIANNISFGLYEGILKHFSDKKVKVISSVGEQSCEKLNHLVGTSFNESAMRCTEGVWMSLVNTKEYIYVTLNFGNFKHQKIRPQEDLLLTMFNTAVSNLILFKNQSRDMLSMVKKFQDDAGLFEKDSKTLQAKLCIILKDVSKADEEVIVKEFRSKISQLVSEEGEDNFISRMYEGRIDIVSWPKFDDAGWSKALSNISKKLVRQEAKHEDANDFLQNIKIIMAKLKICDWTSLEKTVIQIRVATLTRLLPTAVFYGLEQEDPIIEHLMDRDSGEPIDDPIGNLSDILSDYEGSIKILPDSNIQLYDKYESFERLSVDLRDYYEKIVRRESSDDSKWFASFEKFLNFIVERRASRVQSWYKQNTAKFPQDDEDIVNGKYEMEQEINKLTLFWNLCGLICNECGLKCVKNRDHKKDHDCLTGHECHLLCDFVEAHNVNSIPRCSYRAGHEGKHSCAKMNHICGKECSLIGKRNCQRVCSKEVGHRGKHLCVSTRHYCGEDCSLSAYTEKGDYHCPNKCVKPYEEPHESHSCEDETCPIQCPIPNCQKKCQSNNHFHSYDDLMVSHFCGNEHPCQKNCEEDGICKIVTEPKRQIAFTKCIQKKKKLRCNKKIPPFEFEHTGKHTHKDNGSHYCDKKCPFCKYYCTLSYGHTQSHDTRHGNMIIDDADDNEFEYTRRDQRFILCNLRCRDLGRHRHIDYYRNEESEDEESCQSENQRHDIRHVDEQINLDRPRDFISHKLLWERTGFNDPYSVQEREEFTKCCYVCSNEMHQGASKPSYCELPLFHAPLDPNDGEHRFNCEHPE